MRETKILLRFENTVIGEITDAFEHQGTMFGSFQCLLPSDDDAITKRLRTFIQFCKDWFERSPEADASEFDQYRDIVYSGKWTIEAPGGRVFQIEDVPMFNEGLNGEICWTKKSRQDDGEC